MTVGPKDLELKTEVMVRTSGTPPGVGALVRKAVALRLCGLLGLYLCRKLISRWVFFRMMEGHPNEEGYR